LEVLSPELNREKEVEEKPKKLKKRELFSQLRRRRRRLKRLATALDFLPTTALLVGEDEEGRREERAYLSRKRKKEKIGWEMKEISSHRLFICPPTLVFASSRVTMNPHTLPH